MKNMNILNTINDYFMGREFFGNSFSSYAKAFLIFVVLLIILKIFEKYVFSKLKKFSKNTDTDIDDLVISLIDSIKSRFYVIVSLWTSLQFLNFNIVWDNIIDSLFVVFVASQLINLLKGGAKYIRNRDNNGPNVKSAVGAIMMLVKVVIWVFVFLFILSIFNIDITALIAGLGIGGIAVAFAVQGILSDLFSSISLYLDKPFEIDDFVVFGDISGTIKKIGIKTTRIQSLNGEEIIVPNQNISSSLVHNYGRMGKRRVLVKLGVEYSTKKENLISIPEIIERILVDVDDVEFDRCHLKSLGDSAVEFELVYYVDNPDYVKYLDVNQKILLEIKDKFDSSGISFAFPSQTIYLEK